MGLVDYGVSMLFGFTIFSSILFKFASRASRPSRDLSVRSNAVT